MSADKDDICEKYLLQIYALSPVVTKFDKDDPLWLESVSGSRYTFEKSYSDGVFKIANLTLHMPKYSWPGITEPILLKNDPLCIPVGETVVLASIHHKCYLLSMVRKIE